MKLKNSKSIDYSDVNLLSDKVSLVESRENVQMDNWRIIVAPMSALQNSQFNRSALMAGLSLPIHRFCSVSEQHTLLEEAIEVKNCLAQGQWFG